VSGASDTLDPIAAAEAKIMGSKHLMAAVADELSQQQRWLAHYQVAEKRHARRVMLQGVLHRLDLARRALMRVLRRLALLFLRVTRSVASFVSATVVALFTTMHGAATACIAWLRPRAYALALLLRKWLAAFWAWTIVQSRALAETLARWASAAWAWTSVHAAMLARGSVKGAALSASWLGVTSLALVVALWRGLVRILRRTRALSRILARNALQGARIASAWTAAISRALAVTLRQWSAAAWTWIRLEARIFARASLKGTRQASLWTAANASTAAVALQRNVSAGAAWSGANARAASRATLAAASASYSWAALHLWGVSLDAQSPPAEAEHRALVVRRCTALVCVEHKRVHLPMIRAN